MIDELPAQAKKAPIKGRGAVSNRAGRFEPHARCAVDDGWAFAGEDAPRLCTKVTLETVRSALTRNSSPDIPFDRSLNPYRGCEHGCVYCYARPSHAYLNLSPGLDFETRLFAKPGLPKVLETELRKLNYQVAPVMIGANTDPYQPIERSHKITRELLEVLLAYKHPVTIITKSAGIVRDLDILSDLARQGLLSVGISLTTLDADLARTLEPRAATPSKRVQTIQALSDAGVPVCVMAAPMIPTLNDHELEAILASAADAGATLAAYILLRLPREVEGLFAEWLDAHAPGKKARVLSLLKQSRDGQLNDPRFGQRMSGIGVHAHLLSQRFHMACKKLGLNAAKADGFELRTDLFAPPPRIGDQLGLFS
ncbi:MAG: PA0069 family radical SAM protein [Rhodospirillales bacterium]|nr:PA0069 family radical SAM protein [Rhodospirillales bacterium]